MAKEKYPYKETAEIALELIESRNLPIDATPFNTVLLRPDFDYQEDFAAKYRKRYERVLIENSKALFKSICKHTLAFSNSTEFCVLCGLITEEVPF